MLKLFLPVFALIAVVYCGGPVVGNPFLLSTNGNIGPLYTYIGNGFSSFRYSAIGDMATENNADAVDGWFSLGFNAARGVVGGGLLQQYSTVAPSSLGDHVVVTGYAPYNYDTVFQVESTLRLDSQGWATILWEVTNTSPNPVTTNLNNIADNIGADANTNIYSTSDGDTIFDTSDDWVVVIDGTEGDPVLGISFGRGALVDYQSRNSDTFPWGSSVNFLPFETKNILEVLAVGNHVPNVITNYDALTMQYRLHSVLTDERNFYNYITADGYGLLDHLSYQQLFYAVNWNFIAAGIAGKLESDSQSRVVRLDGSIEPITPEPGVYCLFEDRVAQVNFRLSSSGVVDEVVVFARDHGMSFHASLDLNGQPEFLIDGHSIEIPMSRFNGNLVTESAPFQVPFSHIPLSALGEYHVNSLHFRDIFTVVGGYHPEIGGFFNVAIHRRASENRFPGLLNVPHGSALRDVGFSSSVVPDIWFDLSQ